jgi:hypothetical protein
MKFKKGDILLAISGEHCGKVLTLRRFNKYADHIFYAENFPGVHYTKDFVYATKLTMALS